MTADRDDLERRANEYMAREMQVLTDRLLLTLRDSIEQCEQFSESIRLIEDVFPSEPEAES